jgi:hypothetical protein
MKLNPNWVSFQAGSLWLLGGLALIGAPAWVLGTVALLIALATLIGTVVK